MQREAELRHLQLLPCIYGEQCHLLLESSCKEETWMPSIYTVRWSHAESLVDLSRSVRIFRMLLQLTAQGHHCAKGVIKNVLFLGEKDKTN